MNPALRFLLTSLFYASAIVMVALMASGVAVAFALVVERIFNAG